MALKARPEGFTLIEMILVIGIITALLMSAVPFYLSMSNSSQLDAATSILAQDLYIAQTNSRSQKDDSPWGVNVADQTITLFSGNNYASRNTALDITYTLPSSVVATTGQVVYSKLYGLPQNTASFTLNTRSQSRSLVVNNKGMLEY